MRNFILDIKFIRYSPFWWWMRLMHHFNFHFDDYHLYQSFWSSLNSGYHDTEYKYQFEKVWGKNAKTETIVLSQTDFDALQEQLSEPPKFNQNLYDLMNRKSPFEDT